MQFFELRSLFISNPIEAIKKSQDIICSATDFDSYKDFYNYHLQHSRMSTCQREWQNPQMSIHCFNCANNPQSCICLQCFLKGNHQGHDYTIRGDSTGNCDCGDFSLWKSQGFCTEHHGVEDNSHPEDYLDEKLRVALTDTVFKAAFSSLIDLEVDEDEKINHIFQFVSSFMRFGDGFRRLIAISLTEKACFDDILNNIFDRSEKLNEQLQQLCGGLVNDNVFILNFSGIVYKLILDKVIPNDLEYALSSKKATNYEIWKSFWFHCFSKKPIEYNITKLKWDWVSFTLQYTNFLKENFALIGKIDLSFDIPDYFIEISKNIPNAVDAQTSEQIQNLFDGLFSKILTCGSKEGIEKGINDTIVVASFRDDHQDKYYRSIYDFKIAFFELLNCFKYKKDLKLDNLFEELDKSLDISQIFCIGYNSNGKNCKNENDKFISRFLKKVDTESVDVPNCYYFESFHNGASFFYNHPLIEPLFFIFRSDNLNRVKTARFLSMGKFQNLRVQLGIATLKYILSFVCLHQSLTPQNNHSLKMFLSILTKRSTLSYSIPLYLPLFQLILGIKCNEENIIDEFSLKEFFAFEMAREVGLFDNFQNDDYSDEDIEPKQAQMTFTVLYIAILLVIERTLFNFSNYNFIEEQIILALKSGISNIDELNKSYDSDLYPNSRHEFIKIVSEVATTNRRSDKNSNDEMNESSFYLKKEIEWKTITALNIFNDQKVILENEISKSPNNLIKIPEFEPEEKYFFHPPKGYQIKSQTKVDEYDIDSTGLNIRLKELLFTPTILAIVYHTLRCSSKDGIHKIALNDHLAMTILVLISRFVKDIDENSQSKPSFNESTIIKYDSTIADLISKFKRVVFNFNVDDNDNATIRNTLNNKSFELFLKIKIGTSDLESKSFIDILLEKGEIGKNVLTQMSIDISNYGIKNPDSLDQAQINKRRANKLKEDIMNQYKNAVSNYNFNDLDQLDENPTPSSNIGDMCSICSTMKKNEILSYSIYIYRTKIPFIFDKPPLVKFNPQFEIPVDDDLNDQIMNEGENFEEEDEEEEAPDYDEMISQISDFNIDDEQGYSHFLFLKDILIESFQKKLRSYEEHLAKREIINKQKYHAEKLLNSESFKKGISNVERRVTAGNNFVIQFGTCQHPVHPSCIDEDVFNCPIDRSLRNGFLPAIDCIPNNLIFKESSSTNSTIVNTETLTDEIQYSIKIFIDKFSSFFFKSDNLKIDLFIELIKSISSLISTYEIRLRSLPDCLDSSKTKILSRNLFLTTWYAYRIHGKPKMTLNGLEDVDVESRLTQFQRFIKLLIENDEIISSGSEISMKIVSSFVNSPDFSQSKDSNIKEKEIYLFLKRVCLSDYFLLNNDVSIKNEISNLIDWDEILSVSNLSSRYKVQLKRLIGNEEDGNEFEFRPFIPTKLPKEFLHFALKPYEFNIEYTRQFILFNIIDYNFLIKHHNDFEDADVNEDDEWKKNQRNVTVFKPNTTEIGMILETRYSRYVYPSVFLSIGQSSPQVAITYDQHLGLLKPFYLDRFGCTDIGYQRGLPLFLNEERYERLIDEILSGDFAFYLADND